MEDQIKKCVPMRDDIAAELNSLGFRFDSLEYSETYPMFEVMRALTPFLVELSARPAFALTDEQLAALERGMRMRWRPVSEKPDAEYPGNHERDSTGVIALSARHGTFLRSSREDLADLGFTHWMPLPLPPSAAKEPTFEEWRDSVSDADLRPLWEQTKGGGK